MPFAALDDKFHSHDKTVQVGLDGAGLYARALSRCADYLTDGYVPIGWAREVAPARVRKKLTDATFWIEVKGGETFNYVAGDEAYTVEISGPGYFIADYLQYNPTSESVKAKRDELHKIRSEAGKKGAAARWKRDGNPDGKGDGKPVATAWQTDGPLPLPLKNSPKAVTRPPVNGPGEIHSIKTLIDESLKEAS